MPETLCRPLQFAKNSMVFRLMSGMLLLIATPQPFGRVAQCMYRASKWRRDWRRTVGHGLPNRARGMGLGTLHIVESSSGWRPIAVQLAEPVGDPTTEPQKRLIEVAHTPCFRTL